MASVVSTMPSTSSATRSIVRGTARTMATESACDVREGKESEMRMRPGLRVLADIKAAVKGTRSDH